MLKKFYIFLISIFIIFTLGISIRGISGNQTEKNLNDYVFTEGGPLELSPERGRYALTYSILENHTPVFTLPIARFATPDLGLINGKYVSLFAPGVSYIVMPGYLLGRMFNLAQIGTYSVIALFALINAFLIYKIASKLGANAAASGLGALTFLFATPAYAYAVNLYQHHISSFLILLSIYALLKWKNFWSLCLIWFLCASSIVIDNPNLFFMLPIAVFALGRFISVHKNERKINIGINLIYVLTFLGAVLPLLFFLWFNKISYGNPFQLGGTVQGVKGIDEQGKPLEKKDIYKQLGIDKPLEEKDKVPLEDPKKDKKEAVGFFKTRNLINGFYTHFISEDRGIIFFTPVVLFGILGLFVLNKTRPEIAALLISIIGANVLLYSMWGDPYGGWAFGSRYLIPSYALLAVLIGVALSRFKRNYFILLAFLIVLIYSILVNTLGALTSSANPPKNEVLNLEKLSGKVQKYTYERNIDFLINSGSKSFVYREYLRNVLTAANFYWLVSGSIIFMSFILYSILLLDRGKVKNV